MSESEGIFEEPAPLELGARLEQFRPRLERMLDLRLDPRLRRRVDPADILQEAFVEVVKRFDEFRSRRPMPFFLWVRLQTLQTLARVQHRHLGTARRAAGREVTPQSLPAASTFSLAKAFTQPGLSPSKEVARLELLERVRAALDRLDEEDREVLALRYFERLTNEEIAIVLGLTPSGEKKRHARALARLRRELPSAEDVPTPP